MSSLTSLLPTGQRTMLSICRPSLRQGSIAAPVFANYQQVRGAKKASVDPLVRARMKAKIKERKESNQGKGKKALREYRQKDLKNIEQFALCDAVRYLRAFEVGRDPTSAKYEIHIRLKTMRDGPVIRNMLRFPHSVQTESRICVICPPGSRHAKEALAAGAVLIGEQEVFDVVKNGRIEFDRVLCHPDSLDALNKANLGRILGPRGMMPSAKTGTVVEDVANRVEMLRGGTVYRERDAVVRLPIGQLAFSPEQLRDNLRVTVEQIRKDANTLQDRVTKEIYEIVLSSTNGPGFSLSGDFISEKSVDLAALKV
ncbi:ribosomal protein L1-like protein [Aspergillus californicus]